MIDTTSSIMLEYKSILHRLFPLIFPTMGFAELDAALDYSINKRFQNSECAIENNYTKKVTNTSIYDICNFILDKQPIITAYGVLFKRHGTVPNPLYSMVDGFINDRKKEKKEMFKYPKGSEQYEKHNLLQGLLKVDSNASERIPA